jgi:hypothetical protein
MPIHPANSVQNRAASTKSRALVNAVFPACATVTPTAAKSLLRGRKRRNCWFVIRGRANWAMRRLPIKRRTRKTAGLNPGRPRTEDIVKGEFLYLKGYNLSLKYFF